jgi:hypothetical protein
VEEPPAITQTYSINLSITQRQLQNEDKTAYVRQPHFERLNFLYRNFYLMISIDILCEGSEAKAVAKAVRHACYGLDYHVFEK